jgi:hypothetical protein
MKVKDLKELLEKVDPELSVYASDPDRSGICWELSEPRVTTVRCEKEYACSEFDNHNFPIGFQFLKFD